MTYSRSPIEALIPAVAGSPERIAPEKQPELLKFAEGKQLALAIEDGAGFRFSVNIQSSEIVTNICTLEYLWASAHVQIILYDEYSKLQKSGEMKFSTEANERSKNAVDLFRWATHNLESSGKEVWPKNLPKPVRYSQQPSDIHVTNELFLTGSAWMIHHEIAHIRLRHGIEILSTSLQEEREADIAATKWIVFGAPDEQHLSKRVIGIASAILSLQALEQPNRPSALETHPRSVERIDYCLEAAGLPEHHEVYALALVTIQIQLALRGFDSLHDADSLKKLYSEYLVEFAKNVS